MKRGFEKGKGEVDAMMWREKRERQEHKRGTVVAAVGTGQKREVQTEEKKIALIQMNQSEFEV